MRSALERHYFPGLVARWLGGRPSHSDHSITQPPRPARKPTHKLSVLACILLLGIIWGGVVAVAELNALYLCVSLVGCAFILRDFRIGVVLLILLMPISRSWVFPHAMLGITGLNPFNLLLVATLGSYLLRGLSDTSTGRFLPRPLLWLYIVPIIVAGAMGSFHVEEIRLFLF